MNEAPTRKSKRKDPPVRANGVTKVKEEIGPYEDPPLPREFPNTIKTEETGYEDPPIPTLESPTEQWIHRAALAPVPPSGPPNVPPPPDTSLYVPEQPLPPMRHIIRKIFHVVVLSNRSIPTKAPAAEPFSTEELLRHIEERDADFDAKLLVQAGPRLSPVTGKPIVSPPCLLGKECRGLLDQIPGFSNEEPGVILMSSMSKDEYERHVRHGWTPSQSYMCCLCQWYFTSFMVTQCQCSKLTLPKEIQIQWFRSPVNQPHGYKREFCHMPSTTQDNGLVAPVVAYRLDGLRAVKDREGLWHISNERMRFFGPAGAVPSSSANGCSRVSPPSLTPRSSSIPTNP
jgi:hypothetical protein